MSAPVLAASAFDSKFDLPGEGMLPRNDNAEDARKTGQKNYAKDFSGHDGKHV
jgi:hypothetical protein